MLKPTPQVRPHEREPNAKTYSTGAMRQGKSLGTMHQIAAFYGLYCRLLQQVSPVGTKNNHYHASLIGPWLRQNGGSCTSQPPVSSEFDVTEVGMKGSKRGGGYFPLQPWSLQSNSIIESVLFSCAAGQPGFKEGKQQLTSTRLCRQIWNTGLGDCSRCPALSPFPEALQSGQSLCSKIGFQMKLRSLRKNTAVQREREPSLPQENGSRGSRKRTRVH